MKDLFGHEIKEAKNKIERRRVEAFDRGMLWGIVISFTVIGAFVLLVQTVK